MTGNYKIRILVDTDKIIRDNEADTDIVNETQKKAEIYSFAYLWMKTDDVQTCGSVNCTLYFISNTLYYVVLEHFRENKIVPVVLHTNGRPAEQLTEHM
jgi:hypothetical protein